MLIGLPLQASSTQTGVDPEQAAVLPHLQVLSSAHLFVVPVQSPSSLHSSKICKNYDLHSYLFFKESVDDPWDIH